MKIIVPFVLVLGTLVLLLVLAIILLFRKRRAAHAAHMEEQQSIAQRERRRSRRARRHGLLTRREIETIAVESTHSPNAATAVLHDDSSSEEDEEGHAPGSAGGKGRDGGAGGSLGGGCSSVTGSSIDDDRAEVLSGAGGGSSAAPPSGGMRRERTGKTAGGGAIDGPDGDHPVEGDVEAGVVSDLEAAKARRAKDPERSRGGDFTPGSTLTCAICLGMLCDERWPRGCAREGAMPVSLGLATRGGWCVCLRVRSGGWRAATPAGGWSSAAVPGGRPDGVGLAASAGVNRFRVARSGSAQCLGGGAAPLWLCPFCEGRRADAVSRRFCVHAAPPPPPTDTVEFGELKRTLPCSHEYHSTCVRAWLKKVARCPQCNNLTLVVRQRLMRRARRDAEAEERVRATAHASGAALAAPGVLGADAGGGAAPDCTAGAATFGPAHAVLDVTEVEAAPPSAWGGRTVGGGRPGVAAGGGADAARPPPPPPTPV